VREKEQAIAVEKMIALPDKKYSFGYQYCSKPKVLARGEHSVIPLLRPAAFFVRSETFSAITRTILQGPDKLEFPDFL